MRYTAAETNDAGQFSGSKNNSNGFFFNTTAKLIDGSTYVARNGRSQQRNLFEFAASGQRVAPEQQVVRIQESAVNQRAEQHQCQVIHAPRRLRLYPFTIPGIDQ